MSSTGRRRKASAGGNRKAKPKEDDQFGKEILFAAQLADKLRNFTRTVQMFKRDNIDDSIPALKNVWDRMVRDWCADDDLASCVFSDCFFDASVVEQATGTSSD